jgi:hypothetical protein
LAATGWTLGAWFSAEPDHAVTGTGSILIIR